jgi:N6-L-threonylcarbamoyladenine synthase
MKKEKRSSTKMYILGIDTSCKSGAVALYSTETGIVSKMSIVVNLNHSDTIMEAVDCVLKFSGIKKRELSAIAVTIGPGSFTGVRVGLAVAMGIAFSLGIKIKAISTLDILAMQVSAESELVIPLVDARKGRVFYSVYKNEDGIKTKMEEYSDIELAVLLENYKEKKTVFTGDGAKNYRSEIEKTMGKNALFQSSHDINVDAGKLCEIAVERLQDGEGDNIFGLEPIYVAKSQAERAKERMGG